MGVEFPCEQTLEVGIILILKEIILMGDEIEAFRDFHYFLACMGVGIKASRDFHYFLASMGFGFSFLYSLIVIKSKTSNHFH